MIDEKETMEFYNTTATVTTDLSDETFQCCIKYQFIYLRICSNDGDFKSFRRLHIETNKRKKYSAMRLRTDRTVVNISTPQFPAFQPR
jgi:hypothetical protein